MWDATQDRPMRRKSSHDGRGQGGGVRQARRVETGRMSPLPVFLSPSELLFFCEPRSSHRRVLTLYNPYSFSLHFNMLCTAPSLYRVVEAEGSVRPQSCVDLVVRHLDVSPHNWGRRDWFRLEVRGGGQVGGREIWAELRGREEGGGGGEEETQRRRARGGKEGEGGTGVEEEEKKKRRGRGGEEVERKRVLSALSPLLVPTHTRLQLPVCTAVRSVSQWVVCVLVAVLCVAVLMLPLHTETSSVVPTCLHVSTNQKLVCAYTLGLLTMVFL